MNDMDRALRAKLLVNIFLPACAVVLAAFYLLMFRRDNSAPVMDLAGYQVGDVPGFQHGMDACHPGGKKLGAVGWVGRTGHPDARRVVRVVALDDASGVARALKTTLFDREDTGIDPGGSRPGAAPHHNLGFTASLDLSAASPPLGAGALYVAYDDGEAKVLLPLPCRVDAR